MMGSKAYFDDVATRWEGLRRSFFSDEVRDCAINRANAEPGTLAADIGAGTGFITEGLLKRAVRVVAVDQSHEMLKELKQRLNIFDGLVVRHGWSEDLPLPDDTVDYVFANMYLHHVEHPEAAIREMVRILKSNGRLVITDLDAHNATFLRKEHHDRWMGFKRGDIARWLTSAGLMDVSAEGVGCNCCAESEESAESADITIFIASGTKS